MRHLVKGGRIIFVRLHVILKCMSQRMMCLHWCDQLKVISIRVCQGCDPSALHFIGLAYDGGTDSLNSLELLFYLCSLKVKHDSSSILGLASHFGMLQYRQIGATHLPAMKASFIIEHICWFPKNLFVKFCHSLGLFRADHHGV